VKSSRNAAAKDACDFVTGRRDSGTPRSFPRCADAQLNCMRLNVGRLPGGTVAKNAIRTVVSLNPIMIDGTGMCGGCRVLVGGKSKFACVDGPEFAAHEVNFDVLMQRNRMYREAEKCALEEYQKRLEAEGGSAESSTCLVGGGKR